MSQIEKIVRHHDVLVVLEGDAYSDAVNMTVVKSSNTSNATASVIESTFEDWLEFLKFLQGFATFVEKLLISKMYKFNEDKHEFENVFLKLRKLITELERRGVEVVKCDCINMPLEKLRNALETYEEVLSIFSKFRDLNLSALHIFTIHSLSFYVEELEKLLSHLEEKIRK